MTTTAEQPTFPATGIGEDSRKSFESYADFYRYMITTDEPVWILDALGRRFRCYSQPFEDRSRFTIHSVDTRIALLGPVQSPIP